MIPNEESRQKDWNQGFGRQRPHETTKSMSVRHTYTPIWLLALFVHLPKITVGLLLSDSAKISMLQMSPNVGVLCFEQADASAYGRKVVRSVI
jgi:hypothetical protein